MTPARGPSSLLTTGAVGRGDRGDLARPEAVGDRLLGEVLRPDAELVELLAVQAAQPGDVLGGLAHGDVDVGELAVLARVVPVDAALGGLRRCGPSASSNEWVLGVRPVVGGALGEAGDGLDAGRDEHVALAGLDRVERHPRGLHRRGAVAGERGAGHVVHAVEDVDDPAPCCCRSRRRAGRSRGRGRRPCSGPAPGTLSSAVLMMNAVRSSGRRSLSDPLFARPMGERAAETMTASGMGDSDLGGAVRVNPRRCRGVDEAFGVRVWQIEARAPRLRVPDALGRPGPAGTRQQRRVRRLPPGGPGRHAPHPRPGRPDRRAGRGRRRGPPRGALPGAAGVPVPAGRRSSAGSPRSGPRRSRWPTRSSTRPTSGGAGSTCGRRPCSRRTSSPPSGRAGSRRREGGAGRRSSSREEPRRRDAGSTPAGTTRLGHYPVHVRFSDVDVYGHVNNVKYFEYFQEARILLIARLWRGVPEGTPEPIRGRRPDRRRLQGADPVPPRAVRRLVAGSRRSATGR